jgi:hypothetical protein
MTARHYHQSFLCGRHLLVSLACRTLQLACPALGALLAKHAAARNCRPRDPRKEIAKIAQFLALRGATRCPSAYVGPTSTDLAAAEETWRLSRVKVRTASRREIILAALKRRFCSPTLHLSLTSHPISHPNSYRAAGFHGMAVRPGGSKRTEFQDGAECEEMRRDKQQRITKPLHCHCANPAKSMT